MRILMVAPQPFFTPRGTPYSVLNRCRALCALGHRIDLVTYPIGENVEVEGLRIIRAPRIPGVHRVRIGPSVAKLPLDAALFGRTVWQLMRKRYDVLHTHEEAGAFGWWLQPLFRLPHIYDMHSDLAQQLTNFGFEVSHPLTRFASWLERHIVRSARAVIVICPDLDERVRRYAPGQHPTLIENAPLDKPVLPGEGAAWKARHCPGEGTLLLYAGTLEPYQGIPLLLEALAMIHQGWRGGAPPPRLAIVGGRPDQVGFLRRESSRLGLEGSVTFTGQRPPAEMPACLAAADVLVSPRSTGTNTPLKIYSYLRSGRPIVATRLLTHTQVLNDAVAILVPPTAHGVAEGIRRVLGDPALAVRVGAQAAALAAREYSPEEFLTRTSQVYSQLGASLPSSVTLAQATLELLAEG